MGDSPEHIFIAQCVHSTLEQFSETKLLGLQEAQRRTFDYACLLLRDYSRPLISQVLWNHHHGIEKDLRTLLFDEQASLKVYMVRDNVKSRSRIDEVLRAYSEKPETKKLLRGLRIIPVPEGFDADSESQQLWMHDYLRRSIASDLLFGVVFAKLTAFDVATFCNHGGPLGLKFKALQIITTHGRDHGPTFESQVGSKDSPLREVVTMLRSTGLAHQASRSILLSPTLKGRFFLDLSRRIFFEYTNKSTWSDEITLIFNILNIDSIPCGIEFYSPELNTSKLKEIIQSMIWCNEFFDLNLMANVDFKNPCFYSELPEQGFQTDNIDPS